jgi:3-oxoacyl-[acyl-carrier protein] reductase
MTYDEIQVGQTADISHVITAKDIQRFVDLTGDDNRLHVDPEYASKTSFKKPVVHGMLGASFISTVIGTKLPGDGALWFSQSLEFHLPVRLGDELKICAKVIAKEERVKVIVIETIILNQHKQIVTQGIAKVKIAEVVNPTPEKDAQEICNIVLVIGGSGGIGTAVCRILSQAGFMVVNQYRSNKDQSLRVAEELQEEGRLCQAIECDITSKSSVAAMVETVERRWGPINGVVNCSTAKIAATNLDNIEWQDFESHLKNQIQGHLNIVQAVVPNMEKLRYGKIITIDSSLIDSPASNLVSYITAKAALRGFQKALAYDLGPKGIRVNMVSPGMTETDQIAEVPERVRMVTAAKTPLRRLATANDVANAVLFLVSNQSDYLCGEIIRVNGGQVML